MAKSFRQLGGSMRELGSRVERNTAEMIKNGAEAALDSVTENTPVDKGSAVSSWVVSKGSPVNTIRDPYLPGTLGNTRDANILRTQEVGRRKIQSLEVTAYDTLYITNNQPYIGVLNNGSSTQSPAGFVERGGDVALEAMRRFKLLRRR